MQVLLEYEEPEVLDFPEWLRCPYCGDEGTRQNLEDSGHTCCQEFLNETYEGGDLNVQPVCELE